MALSSLSSLARSWKAILCTCLDTFFTPSANYSYILLIFWIIMSLMFNASSMLQQLQASIKITWNAAKSKLLDWRHLYYCILSGNFQSIRIFIMEIFNPRLFGKVSHLRDLFMSDYLRCQKLRVWNCRNEQKYRTCLSTCSDINCSIF